MMQAMSRRQLLGWMAFYTLEHGESSAELDLESAVEQRFRVRMMAKGMR